MNSDSVKDNGAVVDKFFKKLLGFLFFILLAIGVSVFVHSLIIEVAVVEGSSMEPTLLPGDRLIVFKLEYLFSNPKAKDVVVLRFSNNESGYLSETGRAIEYIKRIIAVPGDSIDLKYQQVFLNDEQLDESYAHGITRQKKGDYPIELHIKEFFVMGDNREYSRDSRDLGPINKKALVGKAIFRIWPLSKMGFIH